MKIANTHPKVPKPSDELVNAAEEQIAELSKRIDFYVTEYSIELLVAKMVKGDFVIPEYQREYTWDDNRKSRFIESVLMGLPIPFLFFWEMDDGKLEIVDGSQRLRTLQEFTEGELKLGTLESLPLLSGFKFWSLLESRQRKFKNKTIRGIVLGENTDEQARLDMFERINTSSKAPNPAEVRRGALRGPFMNLVTALSETPTFQELTPMSKKLNDEREREELVARFFAYSDGLSDYKDNPKDFVFAYVKHRNEAFATDPALEDSYRTRFEQMVESVSAIFPYGFASTPNGKATRRARFEAIAIGTHLALEAGSRLNEDVSDWLSSREFSDVTGADGANARRRLEQRIHFVRDRLQGS